MEDSLPQDEMQELINEFIAETDEMLEGLDQFFLKLEETPGDLSLINEIFRAVHSVKGSAGFLGFNRLVDVAHQAENVLNKMRQKEMQATPETIDIILEAVDVLKSLMKEIKESSGGTLINIEPIKMKLSLLLEYSCTAKSGSEAVETTEVRSKMQEVRSKKEEVESQKQEARSQTEDARSEKQETEDRSQKQEVRSEKEEQGILNKSESKQKPETEEKSGDHEKDKTLRIDTERLDQVMDLVGELVLSRNRLSKILSEIEQLYDGDDKIKSLIETASNLNLITTDLQLSVMKMRMVPIRKVFNKFPRLVRDIARKADKKIDLRIYGEATEVDKSVIEEIADPLVHIVRNSIDHGVEHPSERIKKGKPDTGTITLGAYQEGNYIVIEISDDGKGIDPVVVEKKAREKGLITSKDTRLSSKEIISFIFEPGFSTAEKITDISGRGVGMDVVKTNLGRINGIIDVSSEVGKGTKINLKIPLTLAIIQVLMVKTNGEIYALPLSCILETVRVTRDCIKTIDGQEILNVRDRLIPLVRLSEVLDIEMDRNKKDLVYVVLMAIAEKRIGIIVDELCHQEEVVIKSVGSYFSDIKEISGATITGDGKVGLILDPGSLINQHQNLSKV
ncbi:MAG: chemotaxis protein CheA [Nitrospirae bacterium]|nr:chemotaxis protein CheA [Nitrospirota bacterium]